MKAVITSGGKATRVKPISNVIPKALFPLFGKENGQPVTKAIIDLILEALSEAGADDFCIVIGTEKRGALLKDYLAGRKVSFVVQTEPKGFGDAVLRAEGFVGNEPFFLHADDVVSASGYKYMKKFYDGKKPDGVLVLRKVDNPSRYGIVQGEEVDKFEGRTVLKIRDVEEKPSNPKSDIAISAVYIFNPKIFDAIKRATPHSMTGEIELTRGIQNMLQDGCAIYGILLDKDDTWLNTGDPKNYKKALDYTAKISFD